MENNLDFSLGKIVLNFFFNIFRFLFEQESCNMIILIYIEMYLLSGMGEII